MTHHPLSWHTLQQLQQSSGLFEATTLLASGSRQGCGGATIPWHLHYQITSEVLPVEGLPAGHEEAYPTTIRRFSAGDEGAPLAYAEEWMRRDVEHHRVNAMVAGPVSSPTVYVFQRDIRKSHAAAKGLMGGFEVCGDFVYSDSGKRAHFDRASAELARSLLADISPE